MKIIIIDKEKQLYHFDVNSKNFCNYIKSKFDFYNSNNLENFIKKLEKEWGFDYLKVDLYNIKNIEELIKFNNIDYEPSYYGIVMFDHFNKKVFSAFNDYDNPSSLQNELYLLSNNVIMNNKKEHFNNILQLIENNIFILENDKNTAKYKEIINSFLNDKKTSFFKNKINQLINPLYNDYSILLNKNYYNYSNENNSEKENYIEILKNILSYKYETKLINEFIKNISLNNEDNEEEEDNFFEIDYQKIKEGLNILKIYTEKQKLEEKLNENDKKDNVVLYNNKLVNKI